MIVHMYNNNNLYSAYSIVCKLPRIFVLLVCFGFIQFGFAIYITITISSGSTNIHLLYGLVVSCSLASVRCVGVFICDAVKVLRRQYSISLIS